MSILLSLIEYPFNMIGLSRYSDCLGNLLTFVPITISTNGTLTHTHNNDGLLLAFRGKIPAELDVPCR